MEYRLYHDTSSLLSLQDKAFDEEFVISQITLQEIEDIKTSGKKDAEIKYKARKVAKLLDDNENRYKVVKFDTNLVSYLEGKNLPGTQDNIVIASAYYYKELTGEPVLLLTNDINLKFIAKKIFGLKTMSVAEMYADGEDLYVGYQIKDMNDDEMAYFYSHLDDNIYDLTVNEYLIIRHSGEDVDCYKWNGNEHIHVLFKALQSRQFGKVKPLDKIQQCAIDSIDSNDVTLLFGRAGSGKTTLPLAYFMSKLDKGKIKKCYFVYSFEPLRNAKTLGYEKGDHITKLLYSASIGNILASKFGDILGVERLMEDSKIDIIPTANIRGVEFEADSMVVVTEAQNLDSYTLKTILQRCKSGCKQVYEGDIIEQTDVSVSQPGMFRMIEVFKGYKNFGCVKLKNNYRSEISELADKM